MNKQSKVSGVVLAGGLARRMNKRDKGLVPFNNKAMITYALQAMAPVVSELFINANRNIEQYQQFNYPVISDAKDDYEHKLKEGYMNRIIADQLIRWWRNMGRGNLHNLFRMR